MNGNGGISITDYEIWWNAGGVGPVTGKLASMGSTATTYIATSLSAGEYYSFAIKAVNIIGVSTQSLTGSFISATISLAPINLTLVA